MYEYNNTVPLPSIAPLSQMTTVFIPTDLAVYMYIDPYFGYHLPYQFEGIDGRGWILFVYLFEQRPLLGLFGS